MQTLAISLDDIEIGERHRALSGDAVERLALSMGEIGLKQPISIRIADDVMIDGKACDGVPVLVTGAHRLAAAKKLGWTQIDCIEVEDDPIAAELWEIAENLHRCDLTKAERDAHIRRYAELLAEREIQVAQIATPEIGYKKPPPQTKGVARQIADATGLSKDTVRRALRPAPIPVPQAPLDPEDAYNRWASQMNRLWGSVSLEWRERWEAERDAPIMEYAA